MSDATHGGKGDRDRTSNVLNFLSNYDKIFGRKEKEEPLPKPLSQVDIDRRLREWGLMYDCLQNMHLYEYPVEEAKALMKTIKRPT